MAIDVPPRVRAGSRSPLADLAGYAAVAEAAARDPDRFWLGVARERLAWRTLPTIGLEGSFATLADGPLRWFSDGRLNLTESCLDRHARTQPNKTAILWEADEPGSGRRVSYAELLGEVERAARALAALGVEAGDRVIVYMGMVPEAVVAMLACARLGAVHSVVFAGFSAEALADRLRDSGARVIVTQDAARRGGKTIPLKPVVDAACERVGGVRHQLVFRHTGAEVTLRAGRDVWWHEALARAGDGPCPPVIVGAEHPLFVLYTSGSTGRPKGLVHTTGGYATWVSYTHATVFDLREDDVYCCVADIGWITGHSYVVYGPLLNGATTVLFESTPTHPDPGRYWDLVGRHGVTIFYGSPTAYRALAAADEEHVRRHDRSSLRVIGTVGEPIDEPTWRWCFDVVGEGRCALVDTWWQTETGGFAISPIAPATPMKPGSATLPLPGILASLRDDEGAPIAGAGDGRLCLDRPWPGQARTLWGDHARFVETYFSAIPGAYFTGDGARRDADGYYTITGRVDDVINVSGHRIGTAEVEAALLGSEAVTESAVIGFPHAQKGQGLHAFVVAAPGRRPELDELNRACRRHIGAHARLDRLSVVAGLPKTRSGKLMRRLLRKLAAGAPDEELGDLSTLADPTVIAALRAAAQVSENPILGGHTMALNLDPQVGAALQKMFAAVGEVKPLAAGDVKGRRQMMDGLMKLLAAGRTPEPSVETRELGTKSHDGATIALRWYAKKGAAPTGSAALYIHGGGMIVGSVEAYDATIRGYVAQSGVPMLAVEYRLAPEHPHPTPVEDCYAGLKFLVEQARSLGVDPARVAVMGDSAGGGLAAGLALLARDRGGPSIAKQILIYPMLDDRTVKADPAIAPFATWSYDDNITGWDAYLGKDRKGEVSPYGAPARAQELGKLPPAYLEVGQLDIFCDEDLAYARRLNAAGVPVELHLHPGAPHAFESFAPEADVSRRSTADRTRVLRSF